MFGRLEKLKILAFYDETFIGTPVGFFVANVNPESYQISRSITYEDNKDITPIMGSYQKHTKTASRVLSFNIILDSTGILGTTEPVPEQITAFNLTTTLTVSKLHRPPFLIINWGTMVFKCVLTSSTINYTLFSPLGIPLRATLNVSFTEHVTKGFGELVSALQSPDLTKQVIVKEGDTLPLLCYEIYEDSSFYVKVAEVNKIKNFRKLIPGQKLIFPPIVNNGITTG